MNILIVGSGGREHAIAWKIAQSPKARKIYALPGNPGIGQFAENISNFSVDDHDAVIRFCQETRIDLVVVGPEVPLANGIADALMDAGVRCFGPRRAAAQIEASKAFSKDFMARHGIPTARYATFKKLSEALEYLSTVDYPVVIKASGLAAGKGVLLPDTQEDAKSVLEDIMKNLAFGEAGNEVVIEECITGPEVSLLAFTDGRSIAPMVSVQDHKRLLDGDQGPNTGGMGTYAPAPIFTPDLLEEAIEKILVPAVNGLRLEGTPFVGVLYAGLMLTSDGIVTLEFNCRFGDPETQVLLPLLETDLVEIVEACVDGHLSEIDIKWKDGASVCVVLASKGYPDIPESGKVVSFGKLPENMVCFHAGTKYKNGTILTSGGRVFGLTAWEKDVESAVQLVYANVDKVSFEGMQYRADIAHRALKRSSYADSGVSIEAGAQAVDLMKESVKSTYTSSVLAGIGSFGGLFDASALKHMDNPVLVASTDGVGTKVKLATAAGRYCGIGHDIVNHCINDILVQGARPLFFMDYFATSKLDPRQVAEVVTGIAEACRATGIALLGGETAEMPGVYAQNEFDVAGTIVGVMERERILPQITELKAGDKLIGLRSSGPHTNGYSLIRKIFADTPLETVIPELGGSLGDSLLAPHRSYFNVLYPVLSQIKALAHLTGGGFVENIPRVLPDDLDAVINMGSWPVAELWNLIQQKGNIETDEMYQVFNMGIGMVAVVEKSRAVEVQEQISEETFIIGELVRGEGKTILN